jgi:uncharacterized protein
MTNSLKINVLNIPEEGLRFALSESGERFKECIRGDEGLDFTLQKVDVDCLVTKTASTIYIKGTLSAIIKINCSRCLEDVNEPLAADFDYTLIPEKSETREDLELTAEELEISYYQGDFIDLEPIICEQIILQIPIKALCKEECRGLCPHCGINLNVETCNCHLEVVDIRMAALKNIKVKN